MVRKGLKINLTIQSIGMLLQLTLLALNPTLFILGCAVLQVFNLHFAIRAVKKAQNALPPIEKETKEKYLESGSWQ